MTTKSNAIADSNNDKDTLKDEMVTLEHLSNKMNDSSKLESPTPVIPPRHSQHDNFASGITAKPFIAFPSKEAKSLSPYTSEKLKQGTMGKSIPEGEAVSNFCASNLDQGNATLARDSINEAASSDCTELAGERCVKPKLSVSVASSLSGESSYYTHDLEVREMINSLVVPASS